MSHKMPFSTLVFIFGFLPCVLLLNILIKKKYSNYWLALTSLLFYFWGEQQYVWVILLSIFANYIFGLLIDSRNTVVGRRVFLTMAIVFNVGLLGYFKYTNFIVDQLIGTFGFYSTNNPIHLPIGISFFTFEAIAYIADVYRKKSKAMRNPVHLALYIAIFPHLIAGPVIRFHDVEKQLLERTVEFDDFVYGLKRFIIGLAKKVLIANNVALLADQVFNNPSVYSGSNVFWIGLVAYTVQLYFDFSGYSEMAVGLGYMLGFRFIENFNFPYISKSVQEFWRRWNISLGNWFKDYIYIPLGGSKKGIVRTYFNLFVVFLITGIWHGAGWNFILWGLFSFVCILLEKTPLKKLFQLLPSIFHHLYLLLVISLSWVLFRTSSIKDAIYFYQQLFSSQLDTAFWRDVDNEQKFFLILGVFLLFPIVPFFGKQLTRMFNFPLIILFFQNVILGVYFILSISYLITSSYNPFIYFRF